MSPAPVLGVLLDMDDSNSPFSTANHDPYLDYQPHFAFSLPVQILCNGVILTLSAVLLIHLLLTVQSHWALARLNYSLQLSAVTILLFAVGASTYAVLSSVHSDSRGWPYMLDYIAVTLPTSNWTTSEKTLWYTMEATTSGLAHITHIQFLTLMYPSNIEARLIFILMGPLAIASSAMQYTSLSPYQRANDLGDAIRGVCNTTLALLFSFALFIWGFMINRSRAWRTDGGTAAFGAAACFLAVMSVVINFALVFVDNLVWLPTFSWAVVLWQTFLGWWWWVGAGMGIGEIEDMLYLEQKRKQARLRKRARKEQQRERNKTTGSPLSKSERAPAVPRPRASAGADVRSSSMPMSLFGDRQGELGGIDGPRRRINTSIRSIDHDVGISGTEHIEMIPISRLDSYFSSSTAANQQSPSLGINSSPAVLRESTGANTEMDTDHEQGPVSPLLTRVPLLGPLLQNIYQAHRRATIEGATNPRAGIRETSGENDDGGGWGLGSIGLREREDAERRIREYQAERRKRALLPPRGQEEHDSGENNEWVEDEDDENRDSREGLSASVSHWDESATPVSIPPHAIPPTSTTPDISLEPFLPSNSLFWRWGFLRRWRLHDRTQY